MPDGPYLIPDEQTLTRMLRSSGSAEAAGRSLIERLEALEAAAAALEQAELASAPAEAAEAERTE